MVDLNSELDIKNVTTPSSIHVDTMFHETMCPESMSTYCLDGNCFSVNTWMGNKILCECFEGYTGIRCELKEADIGISIGESKVSQDGGLSTGSPVVMGLLIGAILLVILVAVIIISILSSILNRQKQTSLKKNNPSDSSAVDSSLLGHDSSHRPTTCPLLENGQYCRPMTAKMATKDDKVFTNRIYAKLRSVEEGQPKEEFKCHVDLKILNLLYPDRDSKNKSRAFGDNNVGNASPHTTGDNVGNGSHT